MHRSQEDDDADSYGLQLGFLPCSIVSMKPITNHTDIQTNRQCSLGRALAAIINCLISISINLLNHTLFVKEDLRYMSNILYFNSALYLVHAAVMIAQYWMLNDFLWPLFITYEQVYGVVELVLAVLL